MVASLHLAVLFAAIVANAANPWKYLRQDLEAWPYTEDFAIQVGTPKGQVFLYEHGNMTLDRKVETASTSKWPIASMITALVADGTISSLDDKPSKYLHWWTTDKSDPRSNITLRMLLSFTSGFGGGAPGATRELGGMRLKSDPDCQYNLSGNYMACAKQIYKNVQISGEPGKVWSYNSYHLQLAGAMAMGASKLNIQQVLHKYLFKAFGMKSTSCMGGVSNPQLAVCLETTGRDYGSFLHRMLTHAVIPKELTDQMEIDYTPVPIMPAGNTLFGHYCFGHFYECFDSNSGFTQKCKDNKIHADPGAFGYYPLIDRKDGYYLQVVAEEANQFYNRSGIPEYLRVLVKPYVDVILRGDDPSQADRTELAGLTLEDVNYIEHCYNNEPSCY